MAWTASSLRRCGAKPEPGPEHGGEDDFYQLGLEEDWDRLLPSEGERAVVFGTVGHIDMKAEPARVYLNHRRGMDFAIVSFEPDKLAALELDKHRGHYIYVEGIVRMYRGRPQFRPDKDKIRVWRVKK